MTRLLSCSAVVGLVGLLLVVLARAQPGSPRPGAPGPGAGGGIVSPTFALSVCNLSTSPRLFIAVAARTQQGAFRVQGWWTVPKGSEQQCTKIGDFLRPTVWVYATNGEATWGTPSYMICINSNNSFDYTWDGNPRVCQSSEELGGFLQKNVDPKAPGFPWRLT